MKVLRIGAPAQVVLAQSHPQLDCENPEERRAALVESAGGRASPRAESPNSIELPVPVRVQSIIYHQLPNAVQRELSGAGSEELSRSRKEAGQGARCIVKLGIEEEPSARED